MRNKSEEIFKEACKVLVGGVNSPVRAFNSVGGNPLMMAAAEGNWIIDVDGNKYVDLVGSYGPMILGHGHPEVLNATRQAFEKGFSFGATSQGEIDLANEITSAFEGMDKIRFVSSGTEAVLSSIRLARAFTGRNKIIKFAGCYHGHADSLLVAAGSGVATLSLPGSAGVPDGAVSNTLIANYNDMESVLSHFHAHADDLAAIFIEPVAGNMGVVVPEPGFLQELREITQRNGTLLVFDEVMAGYRSCYGGAQKKLGVTPDITCLGKVIGGGFPVGAYGASEDIMNTVAPLGDMYQAGTLSGNPVAMACGLSTLQTLKSLNPYDKFEADATAINDVCFQAANEKGIPMTVNRFGSMVNPFFTNEKVKDFGSAKQGDGELFSKFFWNLIDNGIYIPPSAFEAWFLSATLSKDEMDHVLNGIRNAIKNI